MVAEEHARSPSARPLLARVLRVVLGLALLLGPLIAAEAFMRSQPHWLRPVLRNFKVAMDMKLLFIEHRGACPDVVTLGTSLTDNGLPPRYLNKRKLGGQRIEDAFNFAMPLVRATTMLAQYRWLRREGCKPRSIFVEVSPVVINGEHGGHSHDPAMMSARALLGMPDGFAALRGYDLADQLELATYDRLLIHRRRREIADRALDQFHGELWFLSEVEREKLEPKIERERERERESKKPLKLEWDGKLTGLRKGMSKKRWAREKRKRSGYYERGLYKWWYNRVEREALVTLVREAAAEGTTVVLHAPPVTSLYHSNLAPKLGMAADFEAFTHEIAALAQELPNVVWHNSFTDPSYEIVHFFDWDHLSKRGGKRYTKQLVKTSNAALRAERK